MRFLSLTILALLLAASRLPAVAAPPPSLLDFPSQPEPLKLNTQDACPLEARVLEISLDFSQFNATRYFDNTGANLGQRYRRDTLLWLNLERGMGYGIELGLGSGYATLLDQDFDPDADGIPSPTYGQNFTDFKINALWRFLENHAGDLGLAYFVEAAFPTGRTTDSNFLAPGQGYLSVLEKFALTKQWDEMTLNTDLGFDLPCGDSIGSNRGRLAADAALGWQAAKQFQPCLELNYQHNYMDSLPGSDILSATLEAIVLWQPDVKTFLGLKQDILGHNTDMGTTLYLKVVLLTAS